MGQVDEAPEPFFVPHKVGRRVLGIQGSKYWSLVKSGRITAVGRGRTSRAYWPSIKQYAAEVLAEAQADKVA